jgi:hypothetical protein
VLPMCCSPLSTAISAQLSTTAGKYKEDQSGGKRSAISFQQLNAYFAIDMHHAVVAVG